MRTLTPLSLVEIRKHDLHHGRKTGCLTHQQVSRSVLTETQDVHRHIKKFWIKVHSVYVTDDEEESDGMPSTFACEAGGMRNDAPSHFLHSPRAPWRYCSFSAVERGT